MGLGQLDKVLSFLLHTATEGAPRGPKGCISLTDKNFEDHVVCLMDLETQVFAPRDKLIMLYIGDDVATLSNLTATMCVFRL